MAANNMNPWIECMERDIFILVGEKLGDGAKRISSKRKGGENTGRAQSIIRARISTRELNEEKNFYL